MAWTDDIPRIIQIKKDGAEPIPTRDTLNIEGAADLRDNPTTGASELVVAPFSGTRVSKPNALTGNTNNWTYSALSKSDFVVASATTPSTLTGMVMSTALLRWKLFLNFEDEAITLAHESSSSQPQNRFLTEDGEDVVLLENEWVFLLFDEIAGRIRVLRLGGGGGGDVPVADHGELEGLGDDDHTIYILVNGSRAFTGNQSMGGNRLTTLGAPSASADAVRLQDLNDHKARHVPGGADALATAAAVGLSAATTNAEGNGTAFARNNHTHAIDVTTGTLATINAGDAAVDGTAAGLARRDHQHAVATAAPSTGIGGGNTEGSSTSLARADHDHTIRETGGPTNLTVGAVANGQYLVRAGTAIVGTDPPSGGASLTNSAPANVTKAAAAVGVSAEAARADHKHDVTTAAPAQGIGGGNTEGSATSLARSDHGHALRETGGPTDLTLGAIANGQWLMRSGTAIVGAAAPSALTSDAPANVTKAAAVVGVATTAARADHKHDVDTGAAVGLTAASTNTEGTGSALARATHTHAIDVTTGTLATINAGDAAVDGTAAGLARRDHQHPVATAAAVTISGTTANAEGTSTSLARADHTHAITTGTPVAIGTANSNGSGAALALANHVHDHGTQSTEGHHALVSATAHGFQPRSNRSATTNPGVGDDALDGYAVGSYWVNTSTDQIFFCVDATNGAAVWTTPNAVSLHGSTHNPGAADALATAAAVGLSGDTTNTEGAAASYARSNHTHAIDTTTGALSTINAGDAAVNGTAAGLARRDHQHPVATAAAVGLSGSSTNTEGSSTSLARADHTHAIDLTTGTLSTINAGDTAVDGTAAGVARRDHQHAVATAAPVSIGTANSEGASSSLARADHVHNHGNQTTESHHALVSATAHGFQPRSNRVAVTNPTVNDDSGDGYAVGSYWVNTDAVNGGVFMCQSAAVGAAFWIPMTAIPSTVAGENVTASVGVVGTSGRFARADHSHAHGSQTNEAHHALVSATAAGFQPRSNRTATTNPGVGDDSGDGYAVGSYWINTTTGLAWLCISATVGAAVWYPLLRIPYDGTPEVVSASAGSAGGGSEYSRSNHRHQVSVGSPVSVGLNNADGSSTALSRADHVHAHGTQTSETHHSLTSTARHGFQPRSNRTATTDPGVGDDSADGYEVGSYWVNTTTERVYECVRNTAGNARWVRISRNVTKSTTYSANKTLDCATEDSLVITGSMTGNIQITIDNPVPDLSWGDIIVYPGSSSRVVDIDAGTGVDGMFVNPPASGVQYSIEASAYAWFRYRCVTLTGIGVILLIERVGGNSDGANAYKFQ